MQSYSDELHRAARELTLRYNELTSMREAAKESKQESKRRATELKSLRDTITKLNTQVTSLTEERDQARDTAVELQAKVTDLTTRLARADVRRANLEKELSAATLMRLEVLSQLRTDETQRIRALNRLRQPGGGVVAAPVSPIATRRVETQLSPLSVAKSPSESFLANLQPDLDVDSSEDEVDMRALEDMRMELERRMRRALAGQKSDVFRVSTIELGKAAVSSKGIAVTDGSASASSAAGICHSTNADESVSKGRSNASVVEEVVEVATTDNGDASAPQKQTQDEHSLEVGQISLRTKAEGEQGEHGEMSLDDVSEKNSSAVLHDGEGSKSRADEMEVVSGGVIDLKAVERGTQNGAGGEHASFEVTDEIAITGSPSTASEMQADHHEERVGEQPNTSIAENDETARLETKTVDGSSQLASTSPAGAKLGDLGNASEEGEEFARRADEVTIFDPTLNPEEKPDGVVAEAPLEITTGFAELSDEERHDCPSESVAMTTDEFIKREDENDDGVVLQTMRNSTVVVAVAADEGANDRCSTPETSAGPHPIVASDEPEADCSSKLLTADTYAGPQLIDEVDELEDNCSPTLCTVGMDAGPQSSADINEDKDDCSEAMPAGDTYAGPDRIEDVDEEKGDCSSTMPAAGTHSGPDPIEDVNTEEEESECTPAVPAEDTHAGPHSVEDVNEKKVGGSSDVPEAETHAGPHPIQEVDKGEDDCSSALPAVEMYGGPHRIEDVADLEDEYSSALHAVDACARPHRIEKVQEGEDDCSLALPCGIESESGLLRDGVHTDGNVSTIVGKCISEASVTSEEQMNEVPSTEVATAEPGQAESGDKQGIDHSVIIDAEACAEAETAPTTKGEHDGHDSKEVRGDEAARKAGAERESDTSGQQGTAESGADSRAAGCSLASAEGEERESSPAFRAGRDEHSSMESAERIPESAVVAQENLSCVSVNGAGTVVEPAERSFADGVDHSVPTNKETLAEVANAVEETMAEMMSTVALQTTTNSAVGMEGEAERPNCHELKAQLLRFDSGEVQESGAGKAESKGIDKVTESFRSADSTKLEDEAIMASKTQAEPVSMSRTPWLERLDPKLVKRPKSGTIFACMRPVSPDVPGVISSAVVRKPSE